MSLKDFCLILKLSKLIYIKQNNDLEMKLKDNSFLEAIFVLTGTIIGAGVLGIPKVISEVGAFVGCGYIIIIGLIIMMLNLCVGEIALRTKKRHELTGYAEKYLGKKAKSIMYFSMMFGVYGALVAYLIGIGKSIEAIIGGNFFLYSVIIFFVYSLLIYTGLKAIKRSELVFGILMFTFISLTCIFSLKHINLVNLLVSNFKWSNILLPYGTIFFAFIGSSAIPEIREILRKNEKKLKKAIILGSLIPLITYLIFALIVIGVTGLETTNIATIGLGNNIGSYMILLGNMFAIFSMTTSFLGLGLALKWVYECDYNLGSFKSSLLTCVVPLILFVGLYLFDKLDFLKVINITGAVTGGIEGFMIVLIYNAVKKKSERKPEYSMPHSKILGYTLMGLFILGIVYQFF